MLGFKDTICLSLFSDPCQYCELIYSYQYLKMKNKPNVNIVEI